MSSNMLNDIGPFVRNCDELASNENSELWWKMKYQKLEEQFALLKDRNEELEERILNVVEKVESDKVVLSDEIDQLISPNIERQNIKRQNIEWTIYRTDKMSNRQAKNIVDKVRTFVLERKDYQMKARYKKDCTLAVHLLRCKPSNYVEEKAEPNVACSNSIDLTSKSNVSRISTFPPMAAFLPDENEHEHEDTRLADIYISPDMKSTKIKTSKSFTSDFVERMEADKEYSFIEVHRCSICGKMSTLLSRETQTDCLQPPRPKITEPLFRPRSESNTSDDFI